MTHYNHPNPIFNRLTQYIVLVMLILVVGAVPLLVLLGWLLAAGGVMLMGFMLLLLAAPLVMYLYATPPVTLHEDGLTICPPFWRERFVPWNDVIAMKPYPLLPTVNHEVERRALVGRAKYTVAEGQMLLIRGLPPQYRVTGFFAGERAMPLIALTNRTHTDYETLIKKVRHSCPHLVQSAQAEDTVTGADHDTVS